HRTWVAMQPVLLVAAAVLLFWGDWAISPMYAPFHFAVFFVTAMVCHGELVRLRPPAERLTEFYLWLSVGGAVGGAFSSIVAPVIFDSIAEYPWLIVAACAVRPVLRPIELEPEGTGTMVRLIPLTAAILALIVAASRLTGAGTVELRDPGWQAGVAGACGVVGLALLFLRHRPLELALGAALVLAAGSGVDRARSNVVFADRNFYGERNVREAGPAFTLSHGTTTHGMQFSDSARRLEPIAYYHRKGPVGELFRSLPITRAGRRVAVVGLGTGAVAAYGN